MSTIGIDPATRPIGGPAPKIPYLVDNVLITPAGRVDLHFPAGDLFPTIVGTSDGATIVTAEAPRNGGTQFFRVAADDAMTPIGKPYQDYNGQRILSPAAGRVYIVGCDPNRTGPCTVTQVDTRTGAPLHVLKIYTVVLYADTDGALITGGGGVERWHLDGRVTPVATITPYTAQPVYINPVLGLLVTVREIDKPESPPDVYRGASRLAEPNKIRWRIAQYDDLGAATPDGSAVMVGGGAALWHGVQTSPLRLVDTSDGAVEHTFTMAPGFSGYSLLFENANHFLAVIGIAHPNRTDEWLVRCTTTGSCVRLTGPTSGFSFPTFP